MENSRRLFLTQCVTLTASAAVGSSLKSRKKNVGGTIGWFSPTAPLTIYCTADLKGHIGPLYDGICGLHQIKKALEAEKTPGLVLDAGGFLSGTENPGARAGIVAMMNSIGYSAAGLSGRELVANEVQLAELARQMKFPLVNCNHIFTGELASLVKPYHIVQNNGIRI